MLYYKKWEYNASSVVKVIILLELLTMLEKKDYTLTKERLKSDLIIKRDIIK